MTVSTVCTALIPAAVVWFHGVRSCYTCPVAPCLNKCGFSFHNPVQQEGKQHPNQKEFAKKSKRQIKQIKASANVQTVCWCII